MRKSALRIGTVVFWGNVLQPVTVLEVNNVNNNVVVEFQNELGLNQEKFIYLGRYEVSVRDLSERMDGSKGEDPYRYRNLTMKPLRVE
jgi:hypothetical protein